MGSGGEFSRVLLVRIDMWALRRGSGGESPHFPVGVVPGRVGKVPCRVPMLLDRGHVGDRVIRT